MSSQATQADRARHGSRRRRDLLALAEERKADVPRLPDGVEETDGSLVAWASARAVFVGLLTESTLRIWIDPLRLVGETKGALCVVAPLKICTWTIRRYGKLLGETVRASSEYRGLFIAHEPESLEESDGCL